MKKAFLILGVLLAGVAAKAEKVEGVGKYQHMQGGFESLLVDLVPFRSTGSYSADLSMNLNRRSGFIDMTYSLGGRNYKATCSAFSVQHVSEDLYISTAHEYKMSDRQAEALKALKAKPRSRTQVKATCDVSKVYERYNSPYASNVNIIVDIAGSDFVFMTSQRNSSGAQDFIKGQLTRNDLIPGR